MACRTANTSPAPLAGPQPRGRGTGRRGSFEPRGGARAGGGAAAASRVRRAYTLAESMIASVVLAVAVIGVATTIAASHQQTGAVESDAVAVGAARQLMEEIAAKPLLASDATPGWAGGNHDRLYYDAIGDYAGFTEASPVFTLEGQKMDAGPAEYVRTVKVTYPTSVFGTTAAAGEFALVEVSVRGSRGKGCTLQRLVARTVRER